MDYIDDDVESVNQWELRQDSMRNAQGQGHPISRVKVGVVEQFFNRINVVAVRLDEQLRVGDLIEIGDEYDAIRQRVSSMQVDGNDVQEAGAGDSVGIKLNYKVSEGRDVFRMG